MLVTGIQSDQVFGLKGRFLAAQTRVGWIPVTSTGMRVEGKALPTALVKADGGDREVFALILGLIQEWFQESDWAPRSQKKQIRLIPWRANPRQQKKQAGACFFKIMRWE
ncbi:hypothetical protein [Agrobacterium cavarae]|uniref:hypothetical protein n=1 Tax=Agrobacterium cavarae TaxID=2528239 RepID=UPI003CFDAC9C